MTDDPCRIHGIRRCTICTVGAVSQPGWWVELAAEVETTGLERFPAAWYAAMRDTHAERFPDADDRTKDNMRLLAEFAARRDAQ
jgi:hypothetical protein